MSVEENTTRALASAPLDDSPVTHAQLSAPAGAGLVGYQYPADTAHPRTAADRLGEAVYARDFGAVGDGVTDDQPALQAAINYLQTHGGGVLHFGRGNFRISQGLQNDRLANGPNGSALGRVSFVGDDETTTFIRCESGSAIHIRNGGQDNGGETNASNQVVERLTLYGTNRQTNSAGLLLETVANIHIENVRIQAFDYGIYAQDMDQAYLKRCEIRFNNRGILARKDPTLRDPDTRTQPNNWVLIQCGIGSNYIYGAQWFGGSAISFFGGIVATNGHGQTPGTVGFGLTFKDCGYEGGVGANLSGVYFENNNGIADVNVESTGPDAITGCVHNLVGCSFNRISAVTFAVNSIRATFAPATQVGLQRLNVLGCSFKSLGNYVPDASRPYIAFTITPASGSNFFQAGNLFGEPMETPPIVASSTLRAKFAATQDLPVPANLDVPLQLTQPIQSDGWPEQAPTAGVVIPASGTYTFSVQQVFTSNEPGYKRVRVLHGDHVIATGSAGSSDHVVSASSTCHFEAGDIVTFDVRQETAGPLTAAGANTANAFAMFARVC